MKNCGDKKGKKREDIETKEEDSNSLFTHSSLNIMGDRVKRRDGR